MPFCPLCGMEYIAESTECSDCNVHLVENTDEMLIEQTFKQWITLYDLPGLAYAEMVKEVLVNRGIPCYIQSDLVTGVLGVKGVSSVGAKCKLFVPIELQNVAKNILHQMVDHI